MCQKEISRCQRIENLSSSGRERPSTALVLQCQSIVKFHFRKTKENTGQWLNQYFVIFVQRRKGYSHFIKLNVDLLNSKRLSGKVCNISLVPDLLNTRASELVSLILNSWVPKLFCCVSYDSFNFDGELEVRTYQKKLSACRFLNI